MPDISVGNSVEGGRSEDQGTVASWCAEHYPGESLAQKVVNLIEEVAEIGCVLGVPPEAMLRALEISIRKSDDPVGDKACIAKEIGDTQLSIFNLAEAVGVDTMTALDTVMVSNRERSTEASAARAAGKRGMGLIG